MDEEDLTGKRRRAEAAQWFARLKTRPVSHGTLRDYFAWRRETGNADAFEEAERFWTDAEQVGEQPSILRAVEAARTRGVARKNFAVSRGFVAALAVLLIAVATAGAVYFLTAGWGRDLSTGMGEQRTVALEDGSRLQLNADTQVNVRYAARHRHLALGQGEALFSVAHDVTRPFVVAAGPVTVTAVGTQFEVKRLEQEVIVTLVQGRVDVRQDNRFLVRLKPGQQWRLSDGQASVTTVNAANVTAWTQGRIVFENASLVTAIAEVNRYTGRPVILDAQSLGQAKISGTFQAGDAESFAKAVTALLPLRQRRDAEGRIHLFVNEQVNGENNPTD